jgi:hypothetical protein
MGYYVRIVLSTGDSNTLLEATARAHDMAVKIHEAFGERNLVDRVEILDELETEG